MWMINQYGWRTAVTVVGIGALLIGLPMSLVVRSTPKDKGLLPDGYEVEKKNTRLTMGAAEESGGFEKEAYFTVKEAMATPTFWLLTSALTLRGFMLGGIWVHMVPMLVGRGFDEQSAANAIGLLLAISIPARFGFGWLGDIFPKRYLLALCCLLGVISLVLLLTAQSLWQIYLFVFIFAIGYGVVPLHVAIVGDYFGGEKFATIRGAMTFIYAFGIVTGPIFAGRVYDVTKSYQLAFTIFIGAILISGIVFFMAKRPKPPARLRGYLAS
jgi:sugar phosphate permease